MGLPRRQCRQGPSQESSGCDISQGGQRGSVKASQCGTSLPASRATRGTAGMSLVPTTTQDRAPPQGQAWENIFEVSWSILKFMHILPFMSLHIYYSNIKLAFGVTLRKAASGVMAWVTCAHTCSCTLGTWGSCCVSRVGLVTGCPQSPVHARAALEATKVTRLQSARFGTLTGRGVHSQTTAEGACPGLGVSVLLQGAVGHYTLRLAGI